MDPDLHRSMLKTGPGGPGFEQSYRVAAALSGGGVRAALFGLGVLMAMHDAGKAPEDITSVSGGSITNMMLSQRYFSKPHDARPDWDSATSDTFDALRAGSLTKPWIALMVGLLAFPIITAPTALVLGGTAGVVLAAATTVVWLVALILRGQLIEAVMARRYLGRGWTRRTLGDLAPGAPSQQVFCCTDLVLGQPVYFSSVGQTYRRTRTVNGGAAPATVHPLRDVAVDLGQRYDARAARLSMILRATAGFPGIPPRLVRWRYKIHQDSESPGDPVVPSDAGDSVAPALGFLSDGGVWNNLATEPYIDCFVQQSDGSFDVLIADASGALGPIRSGPLRIPGWSDLKSLVRQASIQNTNTVGPRRTAYDDDLFMELRSPGILRVARGRLYCVVSAAETPHQLVSRFATDFTDVPDYLRYSQTGLGIPDRYAKVTQRVEEVAGGSELVESLNSWAAPPELVTARRDSLALYPTTLGRVSETTAAALVARGYANAAITLYLCNLSSTIPLPQGWLSRRVKQRPAGRHATAAGRAAPHGA